MLPAALCCIGWRDQEVIANENADIDALTVTAVNDFQQNHLDKMDY